METPNYSDEQLAGMRKRSKRTALILVFIVCIGFFGIMYFQSSRVKNGYGLGLGVVQWMSNSAATYR